MDLNPNWPSASARLWTAALAALLAAASFRMPAAAAAFVVNSPNDADDGACDAAHCSLREALDAANDNPGPDEIDFAIPGPGTHHIALFSPLPTLSDAGTVKVSQPKGCTPTTSTVSAAISDPSGVQSAYVLFFHTTIGQVPMSHGSGNTWSAVLAPYAGIGDGTADFQIRAVDSFGNAADRAFGAATVLACIP